MKEGERFIGRSRTALMLIVARITGRRKVHFLHIGKTGGTAVKDALVGQRLTPHYIVRLHSHDTTLADVPSDELAFFFLRDPVDRFVSGFYSRRRQSLPRFYVPWSAAEEAAFERFETADQLATALSSATASDRTAAEEAMNSIGHVKTPYSFWLGTPQYLSERRKSLLFIGFQESLERDFALLSARLALPSGVRLPEDDGRSHRTPSGYNRTLSEEARSNLTGWYAADYELLAASKALAEEVARQEPRPPAE